MKASIKNMTNIQFLLMTLFSFTLSSQVVYATPSDNLLGGAQAFNAYIFSNFDAKNSKADGAIAVGGNIKLNNYSIAKDENIDQLAYTLLVEGNASYDNGRVYSGKIRVAGNMYDRSEAGVNSSPIATTVENKPLDYSIKNSKLFYQSLSISLSALPANGLVEKRGQGIYLRGDCTSTLQVFNVEGSAIKRTDNFDVKCIPENATVIFNIWGERIPFKNHDLSTLEQHRNKVLFNFFQAKKIELTEVKFHGSILAPNARVSANNGDLMGTVIAKSWRGSMRLGHVPFTGNLTDSTEETHLPVTQENAEIITLNKHNDTPLTF